MHKIQKMQYSTDGVNYTDLSSIDMGNGTESSQWMVLEGTLPEGLSGQVYVRWIATPKADWPASRRTATQRDSILPT